MNSNKQVLNHKPYTMKDAAIWLLTFLWLFSIIAFSKETIGFYIFVVVTGLVLILSDFKLHIGSFHKYVTAFYVYCIMSVFWAWNYKYVLYRSTTILEIFICMCVLYDYYLKLNNITILLKIIVWSGYVVMIYSFFYYGWDAMYAMALSGVRVSNDLANVNSICMFAATSVIIDVYLSLYGKARWSLLLAIPTVILIAFMQSRKALFMVLFAPTLLYVYKNSDNLTKDIRPIMRIVLGFMVLGFVVVLFSDSSFFTGLANRMKSLYSGLTGSGETDASTQLRMEMINEGLKQFKQTPLLGIGIGNSLVLTSQQLGETAYLHNNYVELLACGGLTGFLLYYRIHFYLLRNLFRFRKRNPVAILFILMIITTLFTDYGAVSYYSKTTYFYFMLFFVFLENCRTEYPHSVISPASSKLPKGKYNSKNTQQVTNK